ncbi:hypothetical protein AKJ09_06865 [Labilithrix luteola]|uniref:Uncharacterized protein n=1 Tax=Labilithrix luteola TaxID=1391654 RepID=A0A0K1Q3J6_9BACT|nr:hypothetical protein [Labilithrix luteola]AKV00202.1 hypothetical protein AKJ09_06865 [Labilithrix luteola]
MSDSSEEREVLRRALVSSWHTERAPTRLRANLLALATTEAVLSTTSSSSASSGNGAVTQGSNVSPALAPASTAASVVTNVGTWKLVAALALAAGGLAATVVSRTSYTSATPLPAVTSEATTSSPAALPGQSAGSPAPSAPFVSNEIASVSIHDLPSAPSALRPTPRVAAPSLRSESPQPANAGARLAEETGRLAAIRSAVAAGDPREALRLLDGYEAEFASGVLSEEAEVLRIECLERMGNAAQASERARRFLRERPASPYAARVRATSARQP